METSVRASLPTTVGKDQAAAELALTYARAIDAGGDLTRLGPQLLTALEALMLTPRARAAALKVVGGDSSTPAAAPAAPAPGNPLDELRQRRTAR
ncbi:hypothetical protein Pa4123_55920 [Phytohabitans aurantiacus]|uniref:Terminase small subunit actinomycetes phage-type domain-containing protein n=2 Tax=Phytohabitans aurantiacus TaxID=3016789 RepID=A0ABQ5R0Q9_9ACTN|nr:hypothetical protein Pa4123_55920 [Phytohabitans aurantiacus]